MNSDTCGNMAPKNKLHQRHFVRFAMPICVQTQWKSYLRFQEITNKNHIHFSQGGGMQKHFRSPEESGSPVANFLPGISQGRLKELKE